MKRTIARLSVIVAGVAVPMMATVAPALANVRSDDGAVPGKSLGAGMTILLFVVIPVGAFLAIAALSLLPSTLARPRYRPGKPWDHEPRWFGAPDGTSTGSTASGTAKGGASAEW